MASRKSPFTISVSADRPELTAEQVLQASQEANLLAAELLQEAQVLIKLRSADASARIAAASASVHAADASGKSQLGKSTTMRLRGLVEILAGEE